MQEEIYVDGCGIGTGLYHNGQAFFFEVEKDQFISTNDNECLALILGLKYIIHSRIKEAVLFSDSQISVNIMMKNASPREHLNKKAKKYNKLLKLAKKKGIKVQLQWISGKDNLADKPSRAKGEYKDGWKERFAYGSFLIGK